MKDTLFVLPCSATKAPALVNGPMMAQDAYTGQVFGMARAALRACGLKWCILSGGYGFLWPNSVIENYDVKMEPVDENTVWFDCFTELSQRQYGKLRSAGRIVVLGSRLYAEACEQLLGREVCAPFAGLPIGRMMQAIKAGAWMEGGAK